MVAVIVLLMATTTVLDVRRARSIFQREHVEQGLLLADSLGELLANPLYFADLDKVDEISEVVASHPDVLNVRVFAPDGRLLSDTSQEGAFSTGMVTEMYVLDAIHKRETAFLAERGHLGVAAPLQVGSDLLGGVHFELSTASIEAEIRAITLQRLWQFLALILVGVIVSHLIAQRFARRIKHMVEATRRVAGGEFEFSGEANRGDELGELSRSFEDMTGALRAFRTDLEARTGQLGEANEQLHREVSQRQHVEEEVRQLNRNLERRVVERTEALVAVNMELESFSYSVSHDLRGPLRIIDGFSHMLLEDYADRLDDAGKEYLRRIRVTNQHMSDIIDDLLALSRITRGEMRRDAVDLSAMASAICEDAQSGQPERKVRFEIADGVLVKGDSGMLRSVMENLLGNAWKFTALNPQATIEFGVQPCDGEAVNFVRDNGVGFNMDYADKLFGPFERLHPEDEFEGTGIGLATAHRVISRHGGRIWAEGAVGSGATFYFTLG